MKGSWSLALRNLSRNRRRNLATGVALALGYAGMILLGGYALRIDRFLRDNAVYLQFSGHVSIWRDGGLEKAGTRPQRFQLDPAMQTRILAAAAADPRVEFSARYLRGMGLAGNGCKSVPFLALGVEPQALRRVLEHPEVKAWTPELALPLQGRHLYEYPAVEGPTELSFGLARLLGKTRMHDELIGQPPGPAVPDCSTPEGRAQVARDANVQLAGLAYDGSLSAVDAEVVSTFHTPLADTEEGTVLTTIDTLQKLYGTDRVTWISLFLRKAADARAVSQEMESRLRTDGLDVRAFRYDDERISPYYVGTMSFLESLVGFISTLVATVVVLTVVGATTLTLLERTREIGTLRALGFTRGQVTALLVREALALTAIGIGAGLFLGIVATLAIDAANIRFSPPGVPGTIQLLIKPTVVQCAITAAALLPLVAGATFIAVRGQTRRGVAELLVADAA